MMQKQHFNVYYLHLHTYTPTLTTPPNVNVNNKYVNKYYKNHYYINTITISASLRNKVTYYTIDNALIVIH